MISIQLQMFDVENSPIPAHDLPDFGTFKDSLKAPVHSWFRYPAGYSYKFVEAIFAQSNLKSGAWVYDPFSGSGTTLLCARQAGFNGYGVEAHSFVHWVAGVKLYRDYHWPDLESQLTRYLIDARQRVNQQAAKVDLSGVFPELIYKCYHPQDLAELYLLREYILQIADIPLHNLLKLALTDVLRSSAAAGTGWPYISPRKNTGDKPPKGAFLLFERTVGKMYRDLLQTQQFNPPVTIRNVLGDSRVQQDLADGQIDLALTSPPYLNNFDYADRTRLETYFWGITHTWGDITRDYRDHLIVSATTQVVRAKYQLETVVDQAIRDADPEIYNTIQDIVVRLSQVRHTKGGKKDYDLMAALYFNAILRVLQETSRVMRTGGSFHLILGDSAPYGVHISTDDLIGRLGLAAGFRDYSYSEFRSRGGKWKDNPQRHTVPLREGLVTLIK